MAEIHFLPVTLAASASKRARAQSAAAVGIHLKSSSHLPHIRQQLTLLHYQLQTLRGKVADLESDPYISDQCKQALAAAVDKIGCEIDQLVTAGRNLPRE